jgi:hypothetical protein
MAQKCTRRGKKIADDAFLTAIGCGATIENAAAKAGICRTTAHRRLKDPEFQRRLAEFRAETVKRSADMLTAASLEAIKTLLDLQGASTPAAVRLGAARSIIELGTRLRESADMAERLTALEEQLQTNQAMAR